jgi:hypothetical protein
LGELARFVNWLRTMTVLPYIANPREAAAATDLIASFGAQAAAEAAQRAAHARDLGNYVHFCRWRQIGRLIDMLAEGCGTRH